MPGSVWVFGVEIATDGAQSEEEEQAVSQFSFVEL